MSNFFIFGVFAILLAGIIIGGIALDRSVRGLPWWERHTRAREAGGFLFLLCILASAWFWVLIGRAVGVI